MAKVRLITFFTQMSPPPAFLCSGPRGFPISHLLSVFIQQTFIKLILCQLKDPSGKPDTTQNVVHRGNLVQDIGYTGNEKAEKPSKGW